MKINVSKGLKPFIIKTIIICMSVIYVFGPVHVEVNKFLHTITHGLEMPDYMISHKDISNDDFNILEIHESDEHKSVVTHHDHEFIELVEKILEGADQGNDSSDSKVISHKIDKHINLYEYDDSDEIIVWSLDIRHQFSEKEKRICKGFLQGLREPPQV